LGDPASPNLSITILYLQGLFNSKREAREQAFGQSDHVRIYATDYQYRLQQVGFEVQIFDWTTGSANFG
jgi:hypothetical protein